MVLITMCYSDETAYNTIAKKKEKHRKSRTGCYEKSSCFIHYILERILHELFVIKFNFAMEVKKHGK